MIVSLRRLGYAVEKFVQGADRHFAQNGVWNPYFTDYFLNVHSHAGLEEAKAIARADFPADTEEVWFRQPDVCAQAVLRSPSLGLALAALWNLSGRVFVQYDNIQDHTDSLLPYDPTDFNATSIGLRDALSLGRPESA